MPPSRAPLLYFFTDFGLRGPYVGQMKSAVHEHAPHTVVIDLMHDVPPFDAKAGAHLLAALAARLPEASAVAAVVDPGVGGVRLPVAVRADRRWYVGPDNGLLSVVAARARSAEVFRITWHPSELSSSFHGRDLFAPCAALLAGDAFPGDKLDAQSRLEIDFGAEDLPAVIYIDHYGNAMTGVRAAGVDRNATLTAGGCELRWARVFADVAAGDPFWYENSIGLVEIAANAERAADRLGLKVGERIAFAPPG